MGDNIAFFMYLHDSADITDPHRLPRYLEALITQGFFLTPLDADEEEETFPEENYEMAGIAPQLETELQAFLSGLVTDFRFAANASAQLGPAPNLCFIGALNAQEREVSILTDGDYFRVNPDTDGKRCYQQWLDVLMTIYDVWRPAWGYALGQELGERSPRQTDGGLQSISFVYTFGNLWGPELAKQFDQERLATVPADYHHVFADGAVLLIPVTHVLLRASSISHAHLPFEGAYPVAMHLNLAAYAWPPDVQRYIIEHVLGR